MPTEGARSKLLKLYGRNCLLILSRWREYSDWSLISYCSSVSNLGPSSGQQDVFSTAAVVSRTEVNDKENEEENEEDKLPYLFAKNISIDMYYVFLAYRSLIGADVVAERSIMKLVWVDAWVVAMLMCLNQSEKRAWQR